MTLVTRARRILRGLARKMTFVADIAHRADVIIDTTIDAAAIDTVRWRIALNADWCEQLTDDELEFVLAHELFHVLLRTGPRGTGTDAIYWNFAHDMVINQRLAELFGRTPPKRGVMLPADERLDAETVYLRAKEKKYLDQLQDWARSRWQVDAHPDASVALANKREGHGGASMSGSPGLVSYVAVSHDTANAAGDRDAIVETDRLRRPWPVRWLDALCSSGGARTRSWLRPSRRGDASPGRHRTSAGHVDVIFDVTPRMLASAEHYVGMLRAFAIDNGVTELRLISVDETGVVADQLVDPRSWTAVRLPRALVVQRYDDSELVDGTWVCKSCRRPHAATRPDSKPAALSRIDSALRGNALAILAPSSPRRLERGHRG